MVAFDKYFDLFKDEFPKISGGYGRGSSIYRIGDTIVKVMVPSEDPHFDYISTVLALNFLKQSIFAYSMSGNRGCRLGLRTPRLGKVYKDDSPMGKGQIIYETSRCPGEKLYGVMRRMFREGKNLSEVNDESAPKKPAKLFLDKPMSIDDILESRRICSVELYNYMTTLFKKAIAPLDELDENVGGISAYSYLKSKRYNRVKNSPVIKKFKAIDRFKFFALELVQDFSELGPGLHSGVFCEYSDMKSMMELDDVIQISYQDDETLIVLHDDNNKNLILEARPKKLIYHFIDYDELDVGHMAENWFRQAVYPGQYGDLPSEIRRKSSAEQKKMYARRLQMIRNQIDGYIRLEFPKLKRSECLDKKIQAYGVMTKISLRDAAFFLNENELDLSEGFWQCAIDFARLIHNTKQEMLPNFTEWLVDAHERIFKPEQRYLGTDKAL